MNRNFRLTQSADFKRVRRSGKSYAHPLVVLIVSPAEGDITRFGVTAGKAIGKAVQRNRAKRLLREALRPFLPLVRPGWQAILIARKPLLTANFPEIKTCLGTVLSRANLLVDSNEQ